MKRIFKICLIMVSSVLLIGCAHEEKQSKTIGTYAYEQDKDSYIIENDNLKFTLDPATTTFQVLDKVHNKEWNSNPTDSDNDPIAGNQSKKYMKSTLLINYCDDKGMETLYNNFGYSIEKQLYTVEQGEDFVKVNYTIGDVDKVYLFPSAVPESRMKEFLDKMEAGNMKKIEKYYRILDINKLRAEDNKAELLAAYPDLETERVYVIREGTQDYLKKKIEALFEEAGYTRADFDQDEARYSKTGSKASPYFNISIVYRLEGNDLVVELPFEDMEWRDEYPLTKVKVLPYMGAGTTEDDGFILVPEGNGGIINFNNTKTEQSSYYVDLYGWDEGTKRTSLTDDRRANFPVFGIAKNDSSMLCILEDHNSLAAIEADISGRNNSYNYAAASYTTLHASALNLSAKTDQSVMVYEAKKPNGEIKQRYRFLDTNSYSSMAVAYREYLMEKYPELDKNNDASTPVNITLVGSIDEVKHRLGVPVEEPVALTSYEDAKKILKELKETGYSNLSLRYSGWANDGIKQSVLKSVKTISQLGSKKKLKQFIDSAVVLNVPVYLDGMVEYAFNYGLFDGFMVNRDAAKYSSKEIIKLYDYSFVYYGIEDWNDMYYLVKPQRSIEYMQNLAEFAKNNSAQVSFSDIGNLLSADYNPKNLITRQEAAGMQQKELEKIKAAGTKVMVNAGNDYVLPYVDYISDMELSGSQSMIIDYMVPFYSMAIHGLVEYSGKSLNLTANYQDEILRSAESGAGLSFTFMNATAFTLKNSNYSYLFGADFEKWKEEAYKIYSRYEKELGHCNNQFITDHEMIADNVFVTSYEDGTKVYTNYNNVEYSDGNISIPAKDYLVERR